MAAESVLRDGLAAFETKTPKDPARLAEILSTLALSEARNGNPQQGEATVRRALDYARQADGEDGLHVGQSLYALAEVEMRLGRFDDAERDAKRSIELLRIRTSEGSPEVISATVANRAHPETPGLQDVGDIHLRAPDATGFIRVDWFTPAGLPTWGDGRLTIVGTEGYIELRKYVDIAGRPGIDHLFLVDGRGTHYVDCSAVDLPYGRQLIADVQNRTQTAMAQDHCFKAMELALTAQALAERNAGVAQ